MRKKIQQSLHHKMSVRIRLMYIAAISTMIFTLSAGILVYLEFANQTKTRAQEGKEEGGGSNLNNGEIISEFTWEKDPVTASILGPDAIKISKEAHTKTGGKSSTNGLSAGSKGKNIDLEIDKEEIFNQDGIDISIDFRRNEVSGDFFSRGNYFSFGMREGFLSISYKTENNLGKNEIVNENTEYEIPADLVFRTYRFIFTPSTGKAEIFANNIIVWQHQHEKNSALSWKNGGKIIIGRNMNGGGSDLAIFDNLVVRNSGSAIPFAETLLNFMVEPKDGGAKVHWSSSVNNDVDFYTIERSINGLNFTPVANINSRPDSADEEYTYFDKTQATTPIAYYRLKQTFKNKKSVTHELSAVKFNTEKTFSIERVSPSPFQRTFDIAYYLPASGRVWMQISNERGKIIKSETFEAPQGKNIHVFRDEHDLQNGNYTVALIFDNKKITTRVVKSS